MSISTDVQRNKLMHLENTLVMYEIYNAETSENLVKAVHTLHSRQTLYESSFTGQTIAAYEAYSQMHGACEIQHYTVNAMLYLQMIKDKYIKIYNEFILQLQIYAKAVRTLAKGFTCDTIKITRNSIFSKEALIKTSPEYDIVIKKLHLYYVMKLVTYGIDRKRNLIIQFSIYVQPYTKQPLILYQLETVPVLIIDKNTKANSYTECQIKKPYIALN